MTSTNLDLLLNQVGYHNRTRVRDDIQKVTRQFRALAPKVGGLVHNNGSESRIVVLAGTIPIFYHGNQYNIPVELFVMEKYPNDPPRIYVRPTANMTIKSQHQHVDMQGLVYLPYLHEWSTTSDLVGLVEIASQVFSIEPPLFAKPPTASVVTATATPVGGGGVGGGGSHSERVIGHQQPAQQQPRVARAFSTPVAAVGLTGACSSSPFNPSVVLPAGEGGSTPLAQANVVGSAGGGSGQNTFTFTPSTSYNNPPSMSQQNTPSVGSSAGAGAGANAEERKKAELIDQVSMKLYQVIDMKHRKLRDKLDSEFGQSAYLQSSFEKGQKNAAELRSTIEEYRDAEKTLRGKTAEFHAWKQEQEVKPQLTAEERVLPCDGLSEQIARLIGELNAIDDAFYYLERALVSSRNETVDIGTFLKECRKLARQQFMCKAHLRKIGTHCLANQSPQPVAQAGGDRSLAQQHYYLPQYQSHHQQQQQQQLNSHGHGMFVSAPATGSGASHGGAAGSNFGVGGGGYQLPPHYISSRPAV